jgi:hypothetical protein
MLVRGFYWGLGQAVSSFGRIVDVDDNCGFTIDLPGVGRRRQTLTGREIWKSAEQAEHIALTYTRGLCGDPTALWAGFRPDTSFEIDRWIFEIDPERVISFVQVIYAWRLLHSEEEVLLDLRCHDLLEARDNRKARQHG